MLATIAVLLFLLVAGDVALDAADIPVAGPVAALAVLSLAFAARGGATPAASRLFDALIPHAPMFFVPACVGVVANAEVLSSSWFAVLFAVSVGTAVTLVVSGLIAQVMLGWWKTRKTAS